MHPKHVGRRLGSIAALSVALGCSSNSGSTHGAAGNGATGAMGATGNASSSGGATVTGGASSSGGSSHQGGSRASGGSTSSGGSSAIGGAPGAGGNSTARCDDPGLAWKTANKTHYTSYPDPGSAECIQYNGCTWAGLFAACNGKKPESWVASHNIVALFPLDPYADHDLCLRSGTSKIVVTAIDTCGDSDCNGCCTQNKGSADALVDIESYTDTRWGVPDGPIEWADLGLNPNACN